MYTPLYVTSNYSFLSSLVKIDDVISKAKNMGIKSLALCDDNMIGTIHFYKKCLENDIKPIIGYDLCLKIKNNDFRILLYAKNMKGYQNIIKIVTFEEHDLKTINDLLDDVIVIIPYKFKNIYDQIKSSEKYIGISSKKEEESISDKNTVFINKILYLEKKDSEFFKYAIMMKKKLNVFDNIDFIDDNNYMLDGKDVLTLCSKKSFENTNKISDMCNFTFKKHDNLIPKFDNSFYASSSEYLTSLSIKGLEKRFKENVSEIYKNRLMYELNVINKMGFSDYFLIVYDYVKYAKKNKILVGPGRGSAAGSLVAYSLGITDIDPIKYNLIFERFLNKGRVTMPDIDIDFPDIHREDIIKYVRNKYGEYNVAGIVAVSTLKAKAVLDDVARILKIDQGKVDLLKKYIPLNGKLKEIYQSNADFKNIVNNDLNLQKLYRIATFFEGFPKNTTVHASGIIISSVNLYEIIPLIKDETVFLSSFEMEFLEELGLLKMDFLGNRNLTIAMDIMNEIEKNEKTTVNFFNIPLDDEKTLSLFENKDTNGIFQFESSAMKSLLDRLKPKNFEQLIAADALVRPGPDTDTYINRKNNGDNVSYLSNDVKKVLENTYGVLVYQEQVMQIASVMASFTLEEADNLRRAMGKKKREILEDSYKKFINGSVHNGYKEEDAKKMYEDILAFSSYGFNRAHAVSYTTFAYKMGYLKAHFKEYFYVCLLNYAKNDREKLYLLVKEAKKKGIVFLLPDINKSTNSFKVIDEKILFPLSLANLMSSTVTDEIIKMREKGFKDIFDVLSKLISLKVNENVIKNLIYLSSFSSFGYNSQTLIDNLDNLLNYAYIISGINAEVEHPYIEVKEEYSRDFLMSKEKDILGFYLSFHPTFKYKEQYKTVNISNLNNYLGRYVTVSMLVEKVKEISDKNGNKMAFVMGSDDTSDVEVTFFSDLYKTVEFIKSGMIILVYGKVNLHGSLKIIAQKVKILV